MTMKITLHINNIKDFFIKWLRFIHNLETPIFKRYLMIALGVILLTTGSLIYFVYEQATSLHAEIIKLQNARKKTRRLLLDFVNIDAEENRLRAVLEQHKNFNLKIYFEQFCKEHSFTAAPNWDTTVTQINAQVDEIALSATFKGLTTENLVRMLQEFDKTEIIYVKNLRIKNEKNKKITCDVTLATVKTKAG